MKRNKSENLIIDLRGNGGGWTPITYPTLYQLWGDGYLQKNFQNYLYRLLSPLYMQKINTTLEQFNARYHTNYEFGDYTFYESDEKTQAVTDETRTRFVSNSMSCIQDKLAKQMCWPMPTRIAQPFITCSIFGRWGRRLSVFPAVRHQTPTWK